MIQYVFMQYWVASAVLAAANLGVADELDESTPCDIDEVARAVKADAACLFRLLRNLAGFGIFHEPTPRHFVNTPLSAQLRSDHPARARETIRMFGLKSTREAMAEYEHAIRTGQSAFERVHGMPNPFDVIASRPDESAAYHAGMSVENAVVRAIVEGFDFSDIEVLVDLGGGHGTLLLRLLEKNAHQRGVLFDLPDVVAQAPVQESPAASRCTVQAGDMHQNVPSGDGYILKNIAHGWPDEDCVALLRRIRDRGAAECRVFIIENVMPEGNDNQPCKIFDLFLLLGGSRSRVRSEKEFRQLFQQAGFTVSRVVPIAQNRCVVEAVAQQTEAVPAAPC